MSATRAVVCAVTSVALVTSGCGDPPAGPLPGQTPPTSPLSSALSEAGPAPRSPGRTSGPGLPPAHTTCSRLPDPTRLTVRQKAAQVLTVGVASLEDARRSVVEQDVGGIFVGSDTVVPILAGGALRDLTSHLEAPPLVAIDEEGGRVTRLAPLAGPLPSARVMAATMSPEQVRALAAERGRRLHDLGVTVDFAPSIDVSDHPDDSVIGDRSFSADAETVARYGQAFAQGLLDAGITPVFKHFPGHGQSTGDSHLGAVSVPSIDALEHRDLLPFVRLESTPGTAVMVGHLDVSGLTEPGLPSSLSPSTYRLLREGGRGLAPYSGPVFTDDLSGMRAVTDTFTVPDAALAALRAGADSPLWITTAELPAVLDRIEEAVADGSYPADRLDASLDRMLRLRAAAACPK